MKSQAIESLGVLKNSWAPGSLRSDAWAGKNLPFWFMPIQTIAAIGSLFLCAWGAAAAYLHFLKPLNLSPGLLWGGLLFVAIFAPPMFLIHWLGQLLVNRNELAVHEHGVRWAKKHVLFDQIAALSMGAETFNEHHFPTLNVLWKAHWRYGEGVKRAEELEKAATLAFHLKDGRVRQWRNLGQCFSPETLDEFFLEFVERIDGQKSVEHEASDASAG